MMHFILDTEKKVKDKLELLGALEQIQVATKLLGEKGPVSDENLIDQNYRKLKSQIAPVDKGTDEHNQILAYVKNTHGATHNNYTLDVLEVLKCKRDGEEERYTKNLHNKMLLWHGSRLTNYVGIVSQGLRIAPPEAPVTGYMFGKGVYFADMVSKSANYCNASRDNPVGVMILCEVALGNVNKKYAADYYAANLPAGKHSTMGVGKTAPPESSYEDAVYDKDVKVPIGKGVNAGVP
mmetsp:Transcript_35354/g.31809  ORF Transcript_35354/g.31809 Transcript_35354/m.31809 type:complete len:237 (+) Transcript_35354:1423-2133(+)